MARHLLLASQIALQAELYESRALAHGLVSAAGQLNYSRSRALRSITNASSPIGMPAHGFTSTACQVKMDHLAVTQPGEGAKHSL